MTISSTIGYGLLPLDRTLQAGAKKSIDRFGSQTSISSAGVASPQTVVPSRSGGVLSSNNIAEVLKLTDAPPIDLKTLKEPLTGREFLSEVIKRSEATYASSEASVKSLGYHYTQKDVDLIRAATGYNVVVADSLITIVDDNGDPPPAGISDQVWRMANNIEFARLGGALTGEMTPEYLTEMFATYAQGSAPFPEDWLDKALAYLGTATDRKSAVA